MTFDVPTAPMPGARGPGPAGRLGSVLPGLAEGTELAGEFVGAGYKEPPLLVYRGDGQVVRLPELLYQTVWALDECLRLGDPGAGRRPFTSRGRLLTVVAEHLSAQAGREYAAEHVEFLLDKKLAPLGVTTYSDGTSPDLVKPQPMLSLTCRMTMLSERATWFLAGLFTWLFSPVVLVAMIPLILGAASWTLITQPIAGAVEVTIASPASILAVVALAIASTGFHEIGHGTACRYGGVRPGVTGCGFYLAWPVFFTDITNTYRMGRGGRLRADLGGVYFNGIFLLLLTVGYVASGRSPVLLVAILSTSLEAVQQLLPTLRFDGYYIIADLVGIPDLFKYIGPIIRRVLLRRPDDGRLAALKRWPQTVVTVWVLLVVPVLIGQLSLLVYNFPGIVRSDWTGVHVLASHAMSGGNPVLGVLAATVQILLLLFPLAGMTLIGLRLLRGLVRMIAKRLHKAGIVDLTALAGVWGISWLLGIQGTQPEAETSTVGVDSLLESGSDGRAHADADADSGVGPDRERRLWLVDEDDLPAPRRSRRPGMMPVLGAAAALGLAVIMAWTLMPISRQGKAADLQPNKVIGAPSTGRPTQPGHAPASSPGTAPSSGYPGKGEGRPSSSPSGSYGSSSYGSAWHGSGWQGSGSYRSASGHEVSGAGGASPYGTGTGGSGTGQPSSSVPSEGTPSSQPSSVGQPSSGQPSGGPGAPGQSTPGQSTPGAASPEQASNGMTSAAPAASAGPTAAQPSGSQPFPGQPASQQASSQQASTPADVSPSPSQSSADPSSSAQWSPEATGPAGSGSPSDSSQSAAPSQSASPSPSGSGSPSPSGGSSATPSQAACRAPVGGMLLTLIGLCSH